MWLFSVPAGSFFIAMRTEEAGNSSFSVLRGNYTVCVFRITVSYMKNIKHKKSPRQAGKSVMLMDLAMIPKSGGIRQVPI